MENNVELGEKLAKTSTDRSRVHRERKKALKKAIANVCASLTTSQTVRPKQPDGCTASGSSQKVGQEPSVHSSRSSGSVLVATTTTEDQQQFTAPADVHQANFPVHLGAPSIGNAQNSLINLNPVTRSFICNGGPLTDVNKSLANSKNFWVELPHMIVVETRFITQQEAQQSKIYSAQALLPIAENANVVMSGKSVTQTSTQTTPPPLKADNGCLAKVEMIDAVIDADSPNPSRDRAIQIEPPVKLAKAIGIQCNLEDELAFGENRPNINTNDTSTPEPSNKLSEEQAFLIFSRENSIFYLNGQRECLLCGEIESSMDRMLNHLAMHWGPPALCDLCGIKFEHKLLFSTHRCDALAHKKEKLKNKRKGKRKSCEQCPIFWCGTVTNSKTELEKHLRRHYSQVQQRRRACVTFASDRTLVLIRPLNTKFNSMHRCNICLKFCITLSKFIRHRKACVPSFVARLNRQSA